MSTPHIHRTSCNRDCPDACSILATVDQGRVTSLRGDPQHPVTQGFLCNRTNRFLDRQYDPERLTRPLLRKDGQLVEVGWNEALDHITYHLLDIRTKWGPAAIFHYRSGGSLGILKQLCDYFFELFGPVTTKRGDICSGAGDAAQIMDFGEEDSQDLHDLLNAKHILLWGKNPTISNVHLLPVLQEAKSRGTKLVLIDPVSHKTARFADKVISPRPAGDHALSMGVARALFERGGIDPDASSYCDHLEKFEALCHRSTLPEWAAAADVPVSDLEDLADRLADRPCAIQVGWGMQRRSNGASIVRALDALCAVSGNLGIPGGGVSFYFKRRGAFDLDFVKGLDAAPRSVCEPLFGREILELKDPPIKACWITAGNPVVMLPESDTIVRALEQLEMLVVVDTFLTDTARLATVVLPTTTMLEEEDLVGAYGNHYIGSQRAVIPPPDGVLTDLQIMAELARRTGVEGFHGDARKWKERVLRKVEPHGVTLETIETGYVRNPLSAPILFADRKFKTPSGKVNLITEAPPTPAPEAGYPLNLMSLSTEKAQASQWAGPPRKLEGPIAVTVHPDSAAGIPHGGRGRLESAIGTLIVEVRHDGHQRRDVAIIPKGGSYRDGRCANQLIRAGTTDHGEGGSLLDAWVRLVPHPSA